MRRLTWLLWFVIALMPIRGMAHAVMVGSGMSHVAAVSTTAVPCAMHAQPGESGVDSSPSLTVTCQLCDVCHSIALPSPAFDGTARESAGDAPRACLGFGAGRAGLDGLFRPPR